MLTSKKGAANVTLIALIVVAVVLAVALITTAVVLSNANKELKASTDEQIAELQAQLDAQPCITEAEVEAMLAALPEGVEKEEVAKEITAAINSYKMRDISTYVIQLMIDNSIAAVEHPAGLTEDQVKTIVDTAVAAVKTGLGEAEVKALIDEALKN